MNGNCAFKGMVIPINGNLLTVKIHQNHFWGIKLKWVYDPFPRPKKLEIGQSQTLGQFEAFMVKYLDHLKLKKQATLD